MMKITESSTPISNALVRLSIDCSMNVAGRKIVVSMSIPGSPGQLVHRLLDSLGHLHGVGAAELLDDQQQAVAFVDDARPQTG